MGDTNTPAAGGKPVQSVPAEVGQEQTIPCYNHIAYDKEGEGDKVTKPRVPRTSKSFGEPPSAT